MSYDIKHVPKGLHPYEKFWCSHQRWLESQGYMLRRRYRSDWVPSWTALTVDFSSKEDAAYHEVGSIMDATRISDGKVVMLKKVSKINRPYEVDVGLFFSCPPLAADPRNHCVPIYDVLQVPDKKKDVEIIVMPLLRPHDDPPFDTVGEVVEAFRQIFEGIQFMHRHGVAHGDCTYSNLMMDASQMYPSGYHPARPWKTPDSLHDAKFLTRTQRPPRYYLTNFGHARRYELMDGWPIEPVHRGETPVSGRKVEHHREPSLGPNPFANDIMAVGLMLRRYHLEADDPPKHGLDFMRQLVSDMTQPNPEKRPNIDAVVLRFDHLWRQLSVRKLRSRTQFRDWDDESFPAFSHFVRRISFSVQGIHPVPGDKARLLPPPSTIPAPSIEIPSYTPSQSGFSYYFPSDIPVSQRPSRTTPSPGPSAGLDVISNPTSQFPSTAPLSRLNSADQSNETSIAHTARRKALHSFSGRTASREPTLNSNPIEVEHLAEHIADRSRDGLSPDPRPSSGLDSIRPSDSVSQRELQYFDNGTKSSTALSKKFISPLAKILDLSPILSSKEPSKNLVGLSLEYDNGTFGRNQRPSRLSSIDGKKLSKRRPRTADTSARESWWKDT